MKKILFVMILSILTLTGCSNATQDESDVAMKEVEDAMGTVSVPESPKRIVTLTNESTEALVSLGITPVGAVNSWLGDPYYDYYGDALKDTTPVGLEGDPNLEAISSLEPDLIIGNKMRNEDQYDQLTQIAPTVFSSTIRGDWKENFEFYADVVGMSEKGEELINNYNQRINDISSLLDEKGLLDKEVSVVRYMDGKTRMYLNDSFSGVILNDLGVNQTYIDGSEDDFALEITKEQLAENAGDIIIYFTFISNDSDGALQTKEDWNNDPLIQNLDAVKNNQVFEVDDIIWNTGGGIICANKVLDDIEAYANSL